VRTSAVVLSVLCLLVLAGPAYGFELWSDESGERSCALTTSLKWTSLLSHAPDDTLLYPEAWSGSSLWRFRAVLDARPTTWLRCEAAYDLGTRVVSGGAGAAGGAGILPSSLPVPYRIGQLEDALVETETGLSVRHELDRASADVSLGRVDLTVGRQAVGWGRGLLFGAVDIFAPFSPLESDREWRRGVDAVRLRAPVTDRISFDAVGAFGESVDESAFVGRVHGYVGDMDGELLVGRRRDDDFCAASLSLPVLGAELHGELAAFSVESPAPGGGLFGDAGPVATALFGGSRTFDLLSGLYVVAEYHYSGFGVCNVTDPKELEHPGFLERYASGDTQTLGRHAVAMQLSYGFAGLTPLSLTWVVSPVDGSGVLIPSVNWIFSDSVALSASAYVPHGAGPRDGALGSEYGATPAGGLLQISFYY